MLYRPRVVDAELAAALDAVGAVLIEGPKACGKTETARQAARSEARLDVDEEARLAAATDPALVLRGETPRLIDEWQLEPAIWNHVRRAVDDRQGTGQFVLTGSAVPPDDDTRHSGAGRFLRLRMRPMTLSESGQSTEDISFRALLDGEPVEAGDTGLTVERIAELVTIGGWPDNLGGTIEQAQRLTRGYVAEVARTDIQRVDGVRRDPRPSPVSCVHWRATWPHPRPSTLSGTTSTAQMAT